MSSMDELPSLHREVERKGSYDEKAGSDIEKTDVLSIDNSIHVDVWDDLSADGKERPIGMLRC